MHQHKRTRRTLVTHIPKELSILIYGGFHPRIIPVGQGGMGVVVAPRISSRLPHMDPAQFASQRMKSIFLPL